MGVKRQAIPLEKFFKKEEVDGRVEVHRFTTSLDLPKWVMGEWRSIDLPRP
jgi:hypothetical protein